MNPLINSFATLKQARRRALLPYITAGYPDIATTIALLERIDPARCACVELGIPFSDPIADGPVIQASFAAALEKGFRLDHLLDAVRAARARIRVPLIAMVSYSIVYRRDTRRFVRDIADAGINGLLSPDLAFEEAEELAQICREEGLPLVMMIAPTTAAERQPRIAALSEPFIYYQSLAGVTGERSSLPPDLAQHIAALRAVTDKPICVGFGVSTPEHVKQVCAVADGAIVGSAIVRRITQALGSGPALADDVSSYIASLASATE